MADKNKEVAVITLEEWNELKKKLLDDVSTAASAMDKSEIVFIAGVQAFLFAKIDHYLFPDMDENTWKEWMDSLED